MKNILRGRPKCREWQFGSLTKLIEYMLWFNRGLFAGTIIVFNRFGFRISSLHDALVFFSKALFISYYSVILAYCSVIRDTSVVIRKY